MIQRPHATSPASDHAVAAWTVAMWTATRTAAREKPPGVQLEIHLPEIHGAASHLFPSRDHGLTAMITRLPAPQPDAGDVQPPRQAPHVPVLLRAVIEHLVPCDGGVYIDGTFGAGGYTRAILGAAATRVIGIDRDATAIAGGQPLAAASGGRLTLVEGRFGDLDALASAAGVDAADGVVLDLGVSSMQLDTPGRGFSFRHDGPLDMRMGSEGPTAADVVAAAGERDLADIIYLLGEERHSRAVARAIVAARRDGPVVTTGALAAIVSRVVRSRPGDIHPATRTFQALRLFVNDELGELESGLAAAERILKPGGRLVVVSFHSLEDRIVKTFLAGRSGAGGGSRHLPETRPPAATFHTLTRRPVTADDAETADNPRARSAKLRAAERTGAPAREDSEVVLPRLPALATVLRGRPS
jgi:16S rRNA (cytosine1402-N4)-methyltransferase